MDTKDKERKEADQQDKGFAVHDKRRVGREGTDEPEPTPGPETEGHGAAGSAAEGASPQGPDQQPPPAGEHEYIPLTLTSFIMSLSTSALIYLGQVPDPISGKTFTDLLGARQTIDLISLLKEKTKGNLTPDEEALVDTLLYDLRMLFVKANK